jgi:2-iminobutanoate/2-iminopropanoate deaminase
MSPIFHNPKTVAEAAGGYSHGVEISKAGKLLFISGQIPARPDGTVPETFSEQCETAWNNIVEVLNSAGMTTANLVKVTTFLTDAAQVVVNREMRQRYLKENKPALTVIIAQTLDSAWLLEIEAIASSDA